MVCVWRVKIKESFLEEVISKGRLSGAVQVKKRRRKNIPSHGNHLCTCGKARALGNRKYLRLKPGFQNALELQVLLEV